jgi:hypothetical protein
MILRYYPTKDTTLYENYPYRNTGLDAMLELKKDFNETGNASNSRILLDFDYTAISKSIVELGYNPNNFNFNLKMYVAEANEIPVDYNLYCYALSGSWDMGIGRYGNAPETTEGANWYYRNTMEWPTSSFGVGVTGSWNVRPGGGNWYTSSAASQSFNYTTADISLDVTNLIRLVQSQSINFNGFLIKKNDTDEGSNSIFNSLKFFSKDTNTVYLPVLEAGYDDSIITGSLELVNVQEEINIVAVNLKSNYKERSTPTIRFSARYRYPVDVFTTSSVYLKRYKLPVGTQYAIYSAHNDDAIINFSNYTKVSSDDNGNYINLHLDSLQPERYYKILLKVPSSGSSSLYEIYDENWIFKVTRNQ